MPRPPRQPSTPREVSRHGRRTSNLERRYIEPSSTGEGFTTETLTFDTRTTATSVTVLESGREYIITVQGTYSLWDSALAVGTPEADAMFPTVGTRTSTQVGLDADTCFAHKTGSGTIGHAGEFEMDIGGGFSHPEPEDGFHTTPTTGHFYRYRVTGLGSAVSFQINDSPLTDNYGALKITIQAVGGSSDGSGSGSLVPPAGADESILRVISGTPTWDSQPAVTEADLDLSDVTTANVSITKHGLAPKAPNDATKYLDGTGAWSTPTTAAPTSLALATPGSDLTASGITRDYTAGETLAFGDPVYVKSDGKAWKADADTAGTYPVAGLATGSASAGATVTVLVMGVARKDAWTWTVGGLVYLSTSSGLTQTQPAATDNAIVPVAIAEAATRLLVLPQTFWITHT